MLMVGLMMTHLGWHDTSPPPPRSSFSPSKKEDFPGICFSGGREVDSLIKDSHSVATDNFCWHHTRSSIRMILTIMLIVYADWIMQKHVGKCFARC